MSKHLEFNAVSTDKEPLLERVIFKSNGKYIGDVFLDVDGGYYFMPPDHCGAWTGYVLMELAIHLALLNNPMD